MLSSSLHDIFFWNKNVFSAYDCFIKNLTLFKKSMFPVASSLLLFAGIPEVEMLGNPLFWRLWLLFFSCLPSYLVHEKSSKGTTSSNQEFIKSLTILRVKENFSGKLCILGLFNDVTSAVNAIFFDSGTILI